MLCSNLNNICDLTKSTCNQVITPLLLVLPLPRTYECVFNSLWPSVHNHKYSCSESYTPPCLKKLWQPKCVYPLHYALFTLSNSCGRKRRKAVRSFFSGELTGYLDTSLSVPDTSELHLASFELALSLGVSWLHKIYILKYCLVLLIPFLMPSLLCQTHVLAERKSIQNLFLLLRIN